MDVGQATIQGILCEEVLYKMKQGLLANCYSTINGLNLIKHIYTHKHTYTFQEFCG